MYLMGFTQTDFWFTSQLSALKPNRVRPAQIPGEELRLVKLIKRDQARQPPRHLGMAGERGVLGPRQRQPAFQPGRREHGEGDGDDGGDLKHEVRIHGINRYPTGLTDS